MTAQATRVLRVIARLNVGGPARHVISLQAGLSGSGFDSVLVTGCVAPGEVDMTDAAIARGVTPLVLAGMSRGLSIRDVAIVWRLWRLMVGFQPHLVHTHTSKAGAVGRVAGLLYRFATLGTFVGRPRRCRFVHTYHGHIFHSYYGTWRTRMFLTVDRILARLNTDCIVVLGPQQLRDIRDRFGIGRGSRFAVVRLGIDFDALIASADTRARVRSVLGIGEAETVVGIVARLTSIKNHDLFLRIAARVGAARFVIFGDGPDRRLLERRAAELGVSERVVFASTWKPNEICASVDLVALTSRNEGTPLTLIEAMACGKPIVSTAVGGVLDLLGPHVERVNADGGGFEIRERGIAVASNDDAGFAAGILRLLCDPSLRSCLTARARVYAEQNHAESRLVEDITRLYRDLVSTDR